MIVDAEERDLALPPQSKEAEEGVLGSILKSPASITAVADFLRPDDFYSSENGMIFGAMLSLVGDGMPIDYHTLGDRLTQRGQYDRVGGTVYLAGINLATPTAAFIEHYGRIVERTSIMRQLISSAQSIAELAYRDNLASEMALDKASELVDRVARRRGGRPRALASSAFRGLTLAELRHRPQQPWLIEPYFMGNSLASLEGHSDVYKTFQAIEWAYSVGMGREWNGHAVRQGRVLYLLGEGAGGLVRRASGWQIARLGKTEDIDNVRFVVDEMPQLWKGDAAALIAANPGPFALIVVDTLARAMVGGNENQQQDMGMLVDGCEQLRRAYPGAVILLLHHLNLAGNTRGSSVLRGALTTLLRLERVPNTRRLVRLTVVKQKDADHAPAVDLVARVVELGTVDDRGRAETSLVLEAEKRAETERDGKAQTGPLFGPVLTSGEASALEALSALNSALPDVTFAAWRDAAKLPKSSFKDARLNLLRRGLVLHTPEGRYLLSPLAEQAAEEGRGGPKQGRIEFLRPSANGEGRTGPESPLKDSGPRPPGSAHDQLNGAFVASGAER